MTHRERIQAAIAFQDVDRIPLGMWYHLPHLDQDPVALAEEHIRAAQECGLDFIKLMPFGNYQAADYGLSCTYTCTPTVAVVERMFAIDDAKEWGEIKELPGYFGHHGKTLMIAQQVAKRQKRKGLDIPFVQTLFSPLTNARKLAGPRVFDDMRQNPELLHHALAEMTKTCINAARENLNAGAAGFFFATQCSCLDFMTEEEYKIFGTAYDLQILDAIKDDAWFNIIHIHGENTMYRLMANYPVQCVNWHDRWVEPNLAEARGMTDKCLVGGINELWLQNAKPGEVKQHLREAVEMAGRKGLILAPGCCATMGTPVESFLACRDAIADL